MMTEQNSHIIKEIQTVVVLLKAGYTLTENDLTGLQKTLADMRVLLANQVQVEKRFVYALVELFAAIDHSTSLLESQQQVDTLYMLADELYSQLLDIFVLTETQALIAQSQLKELFIGEMVDFAARLRMRHEIDQQRYELMLLSLAQLIALGRDAQYVDKDLAFCCIDCFVALYLPTNVYQEQDRQVLQQRIHTLQNKIKELLSD